MKRCLGVVLQIGNSLVYSLYQRYQRISHMLSNLMVALLCLTIGPPKSVLVVNCPDKTHAVHLRRGHLSASS
jgi:hypothetical protein